MAVWNHYSDALRFVRDAASAKPQVFRCPEAPLPNRMAPALAALGAWFARVESGEGMAPAARTG